MPKSHSIVIVTTHLINIQLWKQPYLKKLHLHAGKPKKIKMKLLLLSTFITCLSLTINGQPILNFALNYIIGDSTEYYRCDSCSVNIGSTGPNKTWDFSDLTFNDSFTHKIVDKSTLPDGTKFPNATYAETGTGSDVYIENSSVEYNLLGITTTAMTIEYTNPQQLFKLPLSYNDNISDTFRTKYALSSFNVTGTGQSTTFADAYGTLILPGKTYSNTLKLSITSFQLDTIQSIPPPNTIQTYTFTTVWFDSFHKSPILRVDSILYTSPTGSNTFKNLYYFKEAGPASVLSYARKAESIFIRYGNNKVIFEGLTVNTLHKLDIYNYSGQLIKSREFKPVTNKFRLDIGNIPEGIYIMQVRDIKGKYGVQKVYVQ